MATFDSRSTPDRQRANILGGGIGGKCEQDDDVGWRSRWRVASRPAGRCSKRFLGVSGSHPGRPLEASSETAG